MKVDSILSLFGLTVVAAMVLTVVSSPNTAGVVRAIGDTWRGTLGAITPAK